MAARLNKRQADSARAHIQANRIVEELQRHLHGEREMTATQIRAAQILLDKSLPNLQSTELQGDLEGQFKIEWNR
ncbi:MAG: hypothetical protein GY813_03850 [Halieaceae bacterium]|nr:hypothetical protein [Halieaceae bacterium]